MAVSHSSRLERAPTIREVADYASVSPKTVSRVLNKHPYVSEGTRIKVEEGIRALGFQPNIYARVLAGGSAGLKVALLHGFVNPGLLGDFLVDLIDQADESQAGLIVRRLTGNEEPRAVGRELVGLAVKGVILVQPLSEDTALVAGLRSSGLVVIAAGLVSDGNELACVGIDDEKAAEAITRHLIDLGHRRIAFISGQPALPSSGRRLAGYKAALKRAGMQFDPLLLEHAAYDFKSGMEAAERLFACNGHITAVFASNDEMAAATISVAKKFGRNVPDDISVVGFDDSVLATAISPSLTTVGRPTREITRLAFDLLRQESEAPAGRNSDRTRRVVVRHELAFRASTANARLLPAL